MKRFSHLAEVIYFVSHLSGHRNWWQLPHDMWKCDDSAKGEQRQFNGSAGSFCLWPIVELEVDWQ